MRTAGSNRLPGELRAADCAPGSPSLDWTLSSTRANVRGCRRIQGLAGTSFWTVWTSPAYGGSGSRPSGLLPHARSRAFSCAVFSCTNASAGPMAGFRPQPGALWLPWRTRHQAPALPQSPFLRHPSRPRVEWPDLPGRGNRQRLSVRRQNLSVPHYHRKANHRHPLVRTTLFRSDAQAQGLT